MKIRYRIWLESDDGKYILGPGSYELLKLVKETGSLTKASSLLGMSYRHAWGLIRNIERNLGEKVMESMRGGKHGGVSNLTAKGEEILEEYERIMRVFEHYSKKPYIQPSLTVDGVLIENCKILLIKRGKEPFKGKYALPGGFVEYGERVEKAILREFKEETGLDVDIIDILGVYSDPHRDPRGHTVSVVFLLRRVGGSLKGGDDAAEAKFFPLTNIPPLAFDHEVIIKDALKKLKSK